MVPIVGPRILKGGKGRVSVVCAQRVSKAKPQAKSWTIQSSVLVDEERGRKCFFGALGNVDNCNNAGL